MAYNLRERKVREFLFVPEDVIDFGDDCSDNEDIDHVLDQENNASEDAEGQSNEDDLEDESEVGVRSKKAKIGSNAGRRRSTYTLDRRKTGQFASIRDL